MQTIDLNLLRVFETLYDTQSVTRAAERLGLTQSAISHALARLRQAIGDPLFVRRAGGLQPTARAIEIAPGIRDGLNQLHGALETAPFDPATASRRFRIGAGVYFCTLLIPDLIARVRTLAPQVSLSIHALGSDLLASLDNGATDIALGVFGSAPKRLLRQHLFREEMVWIAKPDHAVVRDPALLAAVPASGLLQVATGRPFPGHGAFSWENGLERLVVATSVGDLPRGSEVTREASNVHDALTAIAIVSVTDLVALVPRQLARKSAQAGQIAIVQAGEPNGHMDMTMLWHTRMAGDAGLRWLQGLILSCLDPARQD